MSSEIGPHIAICVVHSRIAWSHAWSTYVRGEIRGCLQFYDANEETAPIWGSGLRTPK